jgi:hypothetical protein
MTNKNFKNTSDNWQVWADVFTKDQSLVLEGSETACEQFLKDHNPNSTGDYASLFMIAPHTGRNEDFSKFEC